MTNDLPATPWDLADVWYATSADGHHWDEQGPAVERGPAGAYDERGVFTPGILAHDGRYYLVYQVARQSQLPLYARVHRHRRRLIRRRVPGLRVRRPSSNPILPAKSTKKVFLKQAAVKGAWDSLQVHDPELLYRDGKFWLYYKARALAITTWSQSGALPPPTSPSVLTPSHPTIQ